MVDGLIEIRLDGLNAVDPLLAHVRYGIFPDRTGLEEYVLGGVHHFPSPVNNVVDGCLATLFRDAVPVLVHHGVKALGMGVRPDEAAPEPELLHVLGTDGLGLEFGNSHDGQVAS